MVKKKQHKSRDISNLIIGLLIILLLNYIGTFVFDRYDLTSENRYSLSDATKEMLEELDDIIFVKVYLKGDFPAGFQKLHDETREMLNEFRAYGGDNIQYEFINPANRPDKKSRDRFYKQLYEKGLQPTDLEVTEEEGVSQKVIWPGAILTYKNNEVPVQLLQSSVGSSSQEMLNNSVEGLEYELASAIKKLTQKKKKSIGFITGHGELSESHVADITKSLEEFYHVERVEINGELSSLTQRELIDSVSEKTRVRRKYETLIIAKPTEKYSEKDKFIIDQHIMYGGKVIWLVDPVYTNSDSLRQSQYTMAINQNVNLRDQIFKYGVRLSPNLVQDVQAAPIPVITGYTGNKPKTEIFPWFYFPLMDPNNDHPVVNNLNVVRGEYVSALDTTGNDIKKTVLLTTSKNSKIVNTPTRISLNMLRFEPNLQKFTDPYQPVAVLLEGQFTSVFKNRLTPKILNNEMIKYREKGDSTKMIVVGDGDIIKNEINPRTREFYKLGYDRFSRTQYGNKDFIMNAVNYLCDDSGLIEVRSKSFKIRLLNRNRVKKEAFNWKVINMTIPVLLIIIFGFVQYLIRKRKYTKKYSFKK